MRTGRDGVILGEVPGLQFRHAPVRVMPDDALDPQTIGRLETSRTLTHSSVLARTPHGRAEVSPLVRGVLCSIRLTGRLVPIFTLTERRTGRWLGFGVRHEAGEAERYGRTTTDICGMMVERENEHQERP
jgi:hypothetical protein